MMVGGYRAITPSGIKGSCDMSSDREIHPLREATLSLPHDTGA
jgi:hypothetical protein